MTKFPLVLVAAGTLSMVSASALPPTAAAKPTTPTPAKPTPAKPTPTPAKAKPDAEAADKKPGFFGRVFGSSKDDKPEKPATTPAPSTPTPKKRPATPKPTETTPESQKTTKPESGEPKETPPDKAEPGKKGKKGSKAVKAPANQPPEGADPETLEKWKYTEAKNKAMEDGEVKSLKAIADEATTEEEGRKALRAFNRALFNKMRNIDPSIKDRIDEMESAVLRRLSESQG